MDQYSTNGLIKLYYVMKFRAMFVHICLHMMTEIFVQMPMLSESQMCALINTLCHTLKVK